MIYRRFGATELPMPVLTCGGMRYQQSWKDIPTGEIDSARQADLEAAVDQAVALGITHIETARGYGSSERQLGLVLPRFARDRLIVQTKLSPQPTRDDFMRAFEDSMARLRLDYLDLCSIHGINTPGILDQVLRGGTLQALRELQTQGVVRHVGFSTHGPTEVIVSAIACAEFAYVNLHWFYFNQANWPAILAARARDMGVFIISPNDKGGKLQAPPPKLTDLCAPFTPMGFNDLFCLSHPEVHTISIGAARASDFDAHAEALAFLDRAPGIIQPVIQRLEDEAERILGADWMKHWNRGLPATEQVPGNVPIREMLRLHLLATVYDMVPYARERYNLHGNAEHWVPGEQIDKLDWSKLPAVLAGHPLADRIPAVLRDLHNFLKTEDKKRLSESDT